MHYWKQKLKLYINFLFAKDFNLTVESRVRSSRRLSLMWQLHPTTFLQWLQYSINANSLKMSCWHGNRCRTSYIRSLQRQTSRISSYLSVYLACRCLSSCCIMFTQQAISQLVKAVNGICSQSLLCIPKDFWIIDTRSVRATTPHLLRRVGSLKGTRHE